MADETVSATTIINAPAGAILPRAISWKPGYDTGDGSLGFGGWVWRYDLAAAGPSRTRVTLSYDWSAVGDQVRQRIQFPPFAPGHLDNSLAHLAGLVTA